ncbi:MAG: alanine/glycine:cation symporter family protein [Pseudomonadota bacterium]
MADTQIADPNLIDKLSGFVFAKINLFGVPVEWVVLWMAIPMIGFTIYFGFINMRCFPAATRILRGVYRDDDAPGEVSQFQALATALSGTVGLGNIAGVAIAIAIGGPGATFWMILIGLVAMSLKFAEVTMGVKYRKVDSNGIVSGGPMYYLEQGFAKRGWWPVGKALGVLYAIFALGAAMQLVQVNQSYSQFRASSGLGPIPTEGLDVAGLTYGITIAVLTALVILGGIKGIARVTSKLVPLMCVVYVFTALAIIIGHVGELPAAIMTIIHGAFSPDGVKGGVLGVLVIGMRRAVYSSEAGVGTAVIAHSAAKTREPVSEGMVALLEPFIDTVVVCTMTALVIVITGAYTLTDANGAPIKDIAMTSAAFSDVISGFQYVLTVAVLLFAFSTIISWGYYGEKAWTYLFPDGKISVLIFRVFYCLALILGGVLSTEQIVDLIDSFFFLAAVPNVLGLVIMSKEIRSDLVSYLRRLKSGEIKTRVQRDIEIADARKTSYQI